MEMRIERIKKYNMSVITQQIIILVMVLFLLPVYGFAEDMLEKNYMSAVSYQLEIWEGKIDRLAYDDKDANEKAIVDLAKQMVSLSIDVVIRQMTDKSVSDSDLNDMLYQKSSVDYVDDTYFYQTEPWWVEDYQYYVRQSGLIRQGYAKINLSLYSKDGKFVANDGFEIGERDNTIRCLLTDFNPENYSTGRYAFEADSKGIEILYTRTFGEVLKTVLDIDLWVKGEDSKWSKELLYSIE